MSVGYTMQAAELKVVRCAAQDLAWSFTAERQVLRRLDKAFNALGQRRSLARAVVIVLRTAFRRGVAQQSLKGCIGCDPVAWNLKGSPI